jgi:hypothetical protein
MTDNNLKENEYSFQDQLEHVLELHGVNPENAYVSERDIGNGKQYAVEVYKEDSSTQIFESYWYSESELEAYLEALSNLDTITRSME